MTTPQERIDQLLAAAATGDLDEAEAAELEALVAERPELRAELDALRSAVGTLDEWALAGGAWSDVPPSTALDAAIGRIGATGAAPVAPAPRPRSSRRRLGLVAAAVALVAAGSATTLGVQAVLGDGTVEGPPGTLGAVERLTPSVSDESPLPGRVDAAFVAHTWGTEAVLDVAGTRPGAVYVVYVVDEQGRDVEAGAFLGSAVEVHCRMNAAVLREDVAGLRVADASGVTVATASAPTL